mgnify:CR=1 FL=1
MTKVSEVTVGSGGAASIEFTNIPQTGKDLLILVSAREVDTHSSDFGVYFGINSNIGGNTRALLGTGSAASSANNSSFLWSYSGNPGSGVTLNTFGNISAYIANYANSGTKSMSIDAVGENNATAAEQAIVAAQPTNTAAITSLAVWTNNLNFVQHSTASLYIVS